jgi:rhomboid protease GluP
VNQYPSSSDPQNGGSKPDFERGTPPQNIAGPQRIQVKLPSATPIVTYAIMAVTIGVFLLQLASDSFLGVDWPVYYGLKINDLIARGEFWRLFTPMLLHGSLMHIGFNMYALYILGPRLERFYGRWRFLALYVLSGFGGNVVSMMFTKANSLGASTAIFGLLGAQGVFYYQNRHILGVAARQAINSIVIVALINLVIGLSNQIDNYGHLGGLVGGVAFAWLGGPIMMVTGIYPTVSLTDHRTPNEIIQAAGIVAVFFGILTAGAIYLMR